jgi:hypothetical protein
MKWLASLVVVFLPQLVSAQAGGLVTCSGPDCNMCHFVDMINGIVDWLFGFLVLAAVLALMVAGFRLVVSAGNESAWTSAKSMFTNIIIGFVIVLSAWLIIDTIMKAFIAPGSDFGVWNEIEDCGSLFGDTGASDEPMYCFEETGGAEAWVAVPQSQCAAKRQEFVEAGRTVSACHACDDA